jgi:DsbC/DsbD-like thiol-disulfide interchange protein
VYWKNPGASGAPTTIEINTPDGFIVGEAEFPRPSIFHGDEGLTFGYGESFALFIPVTAPPTLQDGQVDFEVTTSWLACKKLCVMGEKTTKLTISTNYLHHGPTHRDRQLSRWALAIPHQLSDLEQGEVSIVGNTLSISGDTTLRPIRFIGIEKIGVRFGIPEQIIVSGTKFRLPIPLFIDTKAIKGDEIIIEGLLMFGRNSSEPAYVVQHKVQFFHPHVENVIRR